jgi:hypothetical protein
MEGKLSEGAGKREAGFTGHNSIFPPKICCLKRKGEALRATSLYKKKTARKNRGKPTISVLLQLLLLITCFYLR